MNRPRKSILTEWETKLMHIIWGKGRASSDEIREILREEGIRRSDSALRKTLRVMEAKGVLQHTVENRTFFYESLLKQNQAEKDVIHYLSRLFFGDSVSSMVCRALDEAELTPDVVEKMKQKIGEFES